MSYLTDLIAARDAIAASISTGRTISSYSIDGQQVSVSDPITTLKTLNELISAEEGPFELDMYGVPL